jgi:histidine phosphotransfer protein HptB
MSFEKAIEASLAAALGDDHALVAELRGAFIASAQRHIAAMREAKTDEDWRDAALRLRGLAASFGATELMKEAGRAAKVQSGGSAMIASLSAKLDALNI